MKKSLTSLLILLFLPSCIFVSEAMSAPKNWDWGLKPRPFMMRGAPDGDDMYSQGWRDGCQSAFGMVAQGGVRMIGDKFNGYRLLADDLYAAGFSDGGEHCTYVYDWDIT